jgi:hypothetical protein
MFQIAIKCDPVGSKYPLCNSIEGDLWEAKIKLLIV